MPLSFITLILALSSCWEASNHSRLENEDSTYPISLTKRPEQIIKRKGYTCSYNKDTKCANWSAWHLSAEHTDGPYKRKDIHIEGYYLEDDRELSNRQSLSDWNGISEYDHGHLCPSGDNKWDLDAMRETFYLSNMCVQNRQLNQESWEDLESACRRWAKKFGGIYIVTGPIFQKKPYRHVGRGNLPVPDAFFKVVLCTNGEPKAIGFLYENTAPPPRDRMESHACSVDSIEALTEYDFFAGLDDSIEKQVEANPNIKLWK